jgi:uncharacterized protein YaeQ
VALTSTVYHFEVRLSDVDRGVYETLSFKAARHPSETAENLAVRSLAYCLEFTEGLSFSRGISEPDEPALAARDLTGVLQAWIDTGSPDAARLHRASKAAPRVAVYTHKPPDALLKSLEGEKIHRADKLELYAFEPGFIDDFVRRMERRTSFDLSVTAGHLYLTVGGETLSGAVTRLALPAVSG